MTKHFQRKTSIRAYSTIRGLEQTFQGNKFLTSIETKLFTCFCWQLHKLCISNLVG